MRSNSLTSCVRILLLSLCLFGVVSYNTTLYAQQDSLKVHLIEEGNWWLKSTLETSLKDELATYLERNNDLKLVWSSSNETLNEEAIQAYQNKDYDVIIAGGPIVSQQFAQFVSSTKKGPLFIAPFLVHPEIQLLAPSGDNQSLHYLEIPIRVSQIVNRVQDWIPFEQLIILGPDALFSTSSNLDQQLKSELEKAQLHYKRINSELSVDEIIAQIPTNKVLVVSTTLTSKSDAELKDLYQKLAAKHIAVVALTGEKETEIGALASFLPNSFVQRLSRRLALDIESILIKKNQNLSHKIAPNESLSINLSTAETVGVYPSFSVLSEATTYGQSAVYGKEETSNTISDLTEVVHLALSNNPDLIAKSYELSAQTHEVGKAYSNFMPQITAKGTALQIDDDRARTSLGQQPEKTIDVGVEAQQLIFSEKAIANVSIQKKLTRAKEAEFETLRKDIILKTSEAYLQALQTNILVSIKKDNVNTTRTHLELATIKRDEGSAGPEEVYRWEAALAAAKTELLQAEVKKEQAAQQLNRLIGRPLDTPLNLHNPKMDDALFITSEASFIDLIDDPWSFNSFTSFIVEDGLNRSSELKQMDEAVAATKRLYKSEVWSLMLPTIALQAEYRERVYKDGAGATNELKTQLAQLPPPLGSIGAAFPTLNDQFWNVGIGVQLPLFTGLKRHHNRLQAKQNLRAIEFKENSVRQQIEQRIRAYTEATKASYPAIKLADTQAEAAGKALDVVTDAYINGLADLTQLIDVQKQAFQAKEAAANSRYVFMLDLLRVQHAIEHYNFFWSKEEQQKWMEDLQNYLAKTNSTF